MSVRIYERVSYRLLRLGILGVIGGILMDLSEFSVRLWGAEQGVSLSRLGSIGLVNALHGVKFLWMPLLVMWRPPRVLAFLGQRGGWMVLSLLGCVVCLLGMSFSAFFGFSFFTNFILLTVCRTTLDSLIIASQADAVPRAYWGISENFCCNGYHIGGAMCGAGALLLSSFKFSWPAIYGGAAVLLLGLGALIAIDPASRAVGAEEAGVGLSFREILWNPAKALFGGRKGLLIFLFLIGCPLQSCTFYSIRDLMLLDCGFSKREVAYLVKSLSLWGGILGGLCAGISVRKWAYWPTLFWGMVVHVVICGCVCVQFVLGVPVRSLFMVFIVLETFSFGFILLAFYAFQLFLCDLKHIVAQLAVITSLTDVSGQLMSGSASVFAGMCGYGGVLCFGVLCGTVMLVVLRTRVLREGGERKMGILCEGPCPEREIMVY